jgi:hypothetical protein
MERRDNVLAILWGAYLGFLVLILECGMVGNERLIDVVISAWVN